MPRELLFEIGTEEIPAAMAARALAELHRLARERLAAARLDAAEDSFSVYGTPRRLTLSIGALAERQTDLEEEVVGPPTRAAFDSDGNPTKAAEGFAAKNGVTVAQLVRKEVPGKKGEYVTCMRREQGKPALEVLPGLLEDLLGALPWAKSMRWGARDQSFVRPLHWLVALYGGEVVPVRFAGIKSGRVTRGHRFLAPGPIALEGDRGSYLDALRKAFVIADPASRRQAIEAELARVEAEVGARVRPDPALLDEVTFLVEYPVGVGGAFDPAFLEVPQEVIVSAMRAHQRYFALEAAGGGLANNFATIAGTVTRDTAAVRAGNERVLAARLADAQFFFREDRKLSLDGWAKQLDKVVFQAKLGTVAAKVGRVARALDVLADRLGLDKSLAHRAAALCKADLVTHMVGEFPDLQGVMGAHYARGGGEDPSVAQAIVEHYLPRGAGDATPASELGAALAIADRMDTIVGCWAVGLAPTGSTDPYGLRRAALGVLAIALDKGWRVPLRQLVGTAASQFGDDVDSGAAVQAEVLEFFRTRFKGVLVEGRGLAADCVEAALAAGFDDVPDAAARAAAVAHLRDRADFEPLGTAFKRVGNILKGEHVGRDPDPKRFTDHAERVLWEAFVGVRGRVDAHLADADYGGALRVLTELGGPVDAFFEDVLVMADDEAVRANRLALLSAINATFTRIADFRQLAV